VIPKQKRQMRTKLCLPIPEAPMPSPKGTAFWQVAKQLSWRPIMVLFLCVARVFLPTRITAQAFTLFDDQKII